MNFPKAIGLVAVAVALTACGGDDSKSSSTTTKATNAPVTTTVADPTTTLAPPTTVEATTTTVPDYTYVVPVDAAIDGEYNTIIPDDGTYPFDAQNPDHPEALNLREFSLLAGTEVCFHGGGGPGVDTVATANGVALYQYKFGDMSEPLGYLALFVNDDTGVWYWDAAASGVVNYPDGTWSETAWVTRGSC